MRALLKIALIVVVAFVLVGCPLTKYNFTNADITNNGWRYIFTAGLDGISAETETNYDNTTREVVEPDVIRRDGNTLYVLNQYRGLTIVDLEKDKVLAQAPTYGYPRDLYVVGNRAYVLVASASQYKTDGSVISFDVASRLYVVDLTNPDNSSMPEFELKGDLVDSRLVGDVLYAVCADYEYYYDGVAVEKSATSSSWVTSVNVSDPENIHEVAEVSFDGLGNVIQATDSAIFVAAPSWENNDTTITYVNISDPNGAISVAGSATINGYVADKYKMDAHNGVLRVVSNDWNWSQGRKNFITTISLADPANLQILGEAELTDAQGETLYATRFDGDRAYVVTYLQKDPLFVINLSDPANPVVAGKLEVPGWSTYIEPQGNRLLALGVDNSSGSQRVCVSMFDVTDPANPQQIGDKATFGEDWSWSSAYSDVDAFTVLDDVIIVPFSGWLSGSGGYERLEFVSYDDSGVSARGYVDVTGTVLRSFEYGDHYYGVTTEQLSKIDGSNLDSPVVEKTVTLAEYVSNIVELSPDLRAEVITQNETGKTVVRLVNSSDAVLGETETDIGTLTSAHAYGTSVVLVGTDYDPATYDYFYQVCAIDCSIPATPYAKPLIKVDATPYSSGWWYWDIGVIDSLESQKKAPTGLEKALSIPYWSWWLPGDSTFVLGNVLALRCSSATFDVTFGDATPTQGVALVDLSTYAWTYTVGLGFDEIVSINAAGDKLCIGTQTSAGYDFFQPVTANNLRLLDVSSMLMGPTVNVPGTFVQYEPARKLLVVRDDQWSSGWNYKTTLKSLSWDGGASVSVLDKLALPKSFNSITGCGSKIFIDSITSGSEDEESGYYVYAASLSDSGAFALGDGLLVTKQWGSLFDANGSRVYITIGNALAVYDFSGEGSLVSIYETMGYPASIGFGSSYAYVSFGYAGMAKIPL